MNFPTEFLKEIYTILEKLDKESIENLVLTLAKVKANGGRLFLLSVGGSTGHAVNDFRKLVGLEAYCPTELLMQNI
jgi:D-sedoheptulose 7-phosphate isomerase